MKLKITLLVLVLAMNSYAEFVVETFAPGAEGLLRYARFAGDAIMLAMVLVSLMRNKSFYGTKLMMVFMLTSSITFILNYYRIGPATHLNGIREPLYFFSSLVVMHDIFQSRYRDYFVHIFTAYLMVFAIAQLPSSVLQYVREGAGDAVGGTLGWGGSGIITQTLFLITFYMIVYYGSLEGGATFAVRKIFVFLPLLIPCALNETKISFLFLPVMFILLMLSRSKIYKTIPIFVLGLVLLYLLNYYYGQTVQDTSNIFDERFIEKYLVYNPSDTDIPRFQKLIIMFNIMGGNVAELLTGLGYGLFGGGNILGASVAGRSLAYFSGTRMLLFTFWIQGGLVAVGLIGAGMFSFVRSPAINYHTIRRFKWFLVFVLFLSWFYNEAMIDRMFAGIVSYLIVWTEEGGLWGEQEELDLEESTGSTESAEVEEYAPGSIV